MIVDVCEHRVKLQRFIVRHVLAAHRELGRVQESLYGRIESADLCRLQMLPIAQMRRHNALR